MIWKSQYFEFLWNLKKNLVTLIEISLKNCKIKPLRPFYYRQGHSTRWIIEEIEKMTRRFFSTLCEKNWLKTTFQPYCVEKQYSPLEIAACKIVFLINIEIVIFIIEKWTFKGMCEVYYREVWTLVGRIAALSSRMKWDKKRDKIEATCI